MTEARRAVRQFPKSEGKSRAAERFWRKVPGGAVRRRRIGAGKISSGHRPEPGKLLPVKVQRRHFFPGERGTRRQAVPIKTARPTGEAADFFPRTILRGTGTGQRQGEGWPGRGVPRPFLPEAGKRQACRTDPKGFSGSSGFPHTGRRRPLKHTVSEVAQNQVS